MKVSSKHKKIPRKKSKARFWLVGVAFAVALAIHFINPARPEPLADRHSLEMLTQGRQLPVPADEQVGEFLGAKIAALPPLLTLPRSTSVLGVSASDKRIEVDLTNQHVYAFEGNTKIYDFLVSTGKWRATPTGTFTVWAKVRSQKMSGGSKENHTYYYLPNVPYVMFFYNDQIAKMAGFSFHGTYWHSNFGHPMSHGCINMRTSDAQTLFNWATPVVTNDKAWSTLSDADNPGTQVIIYGVTPKT